MWFEQCQTSGKVFCKGGGRNSTSSIKELGSLELVKGGFQAISEVKQQHQRLMCDGFNLSHSWNLAMEARG